MNVLIGNLFIEIFVFDSKIMIFSPYVHKYIMVQFIIIYFFKWGEKVKDFELILVSLKMDNKKLFFKTK